ncbi:hypothetical protein LZ318_03650 [Saccharopolyspora indica]|uniref:hypothetical protein n=1 Tax=Saccharopolyspora indica TaxID=1229659 RepID=UPI0022EB2240|nr:hypothetical protein [Saccharopolyspora indica]MDA3644977.1 hypothetical protein [Saccharopolyspora indica]
MRRTAATLIATAGLLAAPVGQAWATGSWTEEPAPTTAEFGTLLAADSAQGESWAFGYTSDSEGPLGQASAVYRKGEQGWQEMPIESIGRLVDGAVIAPDDVWTISLPFKDGNATTAHWDGRQWTQVDLASPAYAKPEALKAFAPDDVWTVGHMYATRGMAQHWDGKAWTDVPVPELGEGLYSLSDVNGVASDDLWAVGQTTSPARGVALHWDGKAWTEVPVPDVNADPGVPEGLTDVLALAPDDVWIGGYSGQTNREVPFTAHWDGTAWQVFDLAESGKITQLVQVGDQVQLFAVGPNLEPIWRGWTGSSWEGKLAPPMTRVYGATVQDDGTLLGVGDRTGAEARHEPSTATYQD